MAVHSEQPAVVQRAAAPLTFCAAADAGVLTCQEVEHRQIDDLVELDQLLRSAIWHWRRRKTCTARGHASQRSSVSALTTFTRLGRGLLAPG